MKICIDARWIFTELSGIGVHTRELIRALVAIDSENEYYLLFCEEQLMQRTEADIGYAARANWKSCLVPWGVFSLAGQLKLPGWLKREGIDVFHSTNYMIPLRAFPKKKPGPIKCVVTIHDLIPMLFRDHAPKSKKARLYAVYHFIMKQVAARADVIIAVSESSASDIRKHLAPTGQLTTIYNGISERYQPGDEAARTDTVIYVGRFDPYKNVPLLVEAFAELRARIDRPIRLNIVGGTDPRYPEAQEIAQQLGVSGAIDWSEHLGDDALLAAYQAARVLVLPSDYEGFGLPVLEAMACGTPAICARSSSLPEVAGEAGIYFDPGDKEQLVAALVAVFEQDVAAGKAARVEQARSFTWRRAAEQTLEQYLA